MLQVRQKPVTGNQVPPLWENRKLRLLAGVASASLPPLPRGEEIYDLRNVASIPVPWGWWPVLVLLALVGWWVWRWWLVRMARRKKTAVIPPPDPLEVALKEMKRLRASAIWSEGRIKDIGERLTRIFKEFLFHKFGLSFGAGATSDELLNDLRRQKVDDLLIQEVARLEEMNDQVKFARGSLGLLTTEELYQSYLELIQRRDWLA